MFTVQEAHEILNDHDPRLIQELNDIARSSLEPLYKQLESPLTPEKLLQVNAEIIAYSKIKNRARELLSNYEIALEVLERED